MRTRLKVALSVLALASLLAPPALASAPGDPVLQGVPLEKPKKRKRIRSVLRRGGLAKLPSVAQALAGRAAAGGIRAALVTGTPPTLLSIPDQAIADLFWQPGVLDAIAAGTASPEQCGQFWAGSRDGESGGYGACRMAEGFGYSFGDIVAGETSLCYMKKFPTAENLEAGALVLLAGAFPGGDPSRLFSVPAGSRARVVKVNVSGQEHGAETVFLRVFSGAENRASGHLYAVDLWFCAADGGATRGFDRIRITTAGEYTYEEHSAEDEGSHVSRVSGFVSFDDGRLTYDTTRGRRAEVASIWGPGSHKAEHTIEADDTITSKTFGVYEEGTNRSFVVTSFTGASLETVRFLAGAFKERHEGSQSGPGNEFVGSTEFRSTFYAASPGSALEARLSAVDLAGDPFYATPAAPVVDASAFSCAEAADIELSLDFTHPAAQAVQQACEKRHWERMNFCSSDPTVRAAETAWFTSCNGPH